MANTRTTLGSQVTLDKLVAHQLEELVDDFVGQVGSYALHKNAGLRSVAFSGCTGIGQYGLAGCTNLECVDIGGNSCTIAANAFNGNVAMNALILSGSTVATLSATSALNATKIARGLGGIYVPDNLVNSYKTATNWSTFAANIYPISEYPRTDYSTISDTWEQIFAAEDNGTYSSKYHVGDTKSLEINGDTIYMQIAAIDSDALSDGSGNAKISWLCKNEYASHSMNSSANTAGGWASCGMRTYLTDTVLPLIPAIVRNHIKTVEKTYYDLGTPGTLTASDSIWIPSYREVFGGTSVEDSGAAYSSLFTSNTTWTQYNSSGSVHPWWLRSPQSIYDYYCVDAYGSSHGNAPSNYGVVFGFCT